MLIFDQYFSQSLLKQLPQINIKCIVYSTSTVILEIFHRQIHHILPLERKGLMETVCQGTSTLQRLIDWKSEIVNLLSVQGTALTCIILGNKAQSCMKIKTHVVPKQKTQLYCKDRALQQSHYHFLKEKSHNYTYRMRTLVFFCRILKSQQHFFVADANPMNHCPVQRVRHKYSWPKKLPKRHTNCLHVYIFYVQNRPFVLFIMFSNWSFLSSYFLVFKYGTSLSRWGEVPYAKTGKYKDRKLESRRTRGSQEIHEYLEHM